MPKTIVGYTVSDDGEMKPRYDGDTGDVSVSEYDDLKVADLKAEIADRNADRGEDAQISADGNKADLIFALVADDEATGPQ